ncbi:MAG TPA: MerR family transcriptional regulator [Actinomycetota bacterium]|nr:MerR family transcriptional regulator [Actinomycetota bacterium]
MKTEPRTWKVGELATATGLTVRTLHHYDRIGLLSPRERTPAGYRVYGPDEVRRLYQIAALRRLGLSLDDVAKVLVTEDADARSTIRRHLDAVEKAIAANERLRERLERLLDALDRMDASSDGYVDVMEVMTMQESYYTPEQLEQLRARYEEYGEDRIKAVEKEWADLIAAAEELRAAGTDPSDPRVQQIATRWQELIEMFTGGDPGIRESLQKMYETEGPEKASRGMVNPELMEYIARAMGSRA